MEQPNKTTPESLERFQQLKSLYLHDPGNARLARDTVDAALRAGAYDFVLERTEKALAATPSDLHALFDRASALIGKHDYRGAIATLQSVLEREPGLPAAQVNLGLCHYLLQEYGAALPALNAAYASGDRSGNLLGLLISTHHHLGNIDEAFELCEANPQPRGSDARVSGIYALVYLDYEEAQKARVWATRALAANPRSVDGLVVAGTLDIADMQLERAREQFQLTLEVAPENARAFIGLGTLALLDNDMPRARKELQRGAQLMPTHVGSWHVLAWANLLSNDLDAAEAALNRALELDRNFAETHGGLASVAALRGEREKAEQLIEIALRIDESCLAAQFARSVLLGLAGNPDKAKRLIARTAASLASEQRSLLSRVINRSTFH
jgi:tetratricopeptide (TPR) repeat protein